jgi:hypothetical protein
MSGESGNILDLGRRRVVLRSTDHTVWGVEMSNQGSRFLVRCRVSKGFFETELLVMVASSSAYVSRNNVTVSGNLAAGEVDGLVAAYMIQTNGDRVLIELPGEPVVGGIRNWVPVSDISAAA